MSLAGELRRLAERLDTPDAKPARQLRIPLPLYRLFHRLQLLTPIATVLDIGANVGKWAECATKFFQDAEVHAFEPLSCCFQDLDARVARYPRMHGHHFALGPESGEAEMFENDYTPSSSLLPMTERHREMWPKTSHDKKTLVPVKSLDDFAAETKLPAPIFLKIDVQGFEMNVFRGAAETLRNVAAILTEVQFDEFYENQADFLELQNFLAQHGFRFLEFCDERRLRDEHRLVYANAVFVKKDLRYP